MAQSPAPPPAPPPASIVFFDGYCGVCDAFVSWLMPWAARANLKFASLQGTTYAEVLARHPELRTVDSVVFAEGERVSTRGTAALAILRRLGGWWWIPRLALGAVPGRARDIFYDLFARYRYRLAARRTTCRLPTPEERRFFLP